MNGKNVKEETVFGKDDTVVKGEQPLDDAYRRVCRLVNISMLATFLREYPLTYLKEDERRVFLGFEEYVVHLENELFREMRLY